MLRRMHLTNVSESIEAKYWVSWLSFDVYKRDTSYEFELEFVILCSNRWLKVFTLQCPQTGIDRHLEEDVKAHLSLVSEIAVQQQKELTELRELVRHCRPFSHGKLLWKLDDFRARWVLGSLLGAKPQFIFLTQEKSRFAWLRPCIIRPQWFARLQP